MSDLVAFVRARAAEKAAGAWAVHDVSKCDALLYEEDMAAAAARDPDCDCGWPARVLREVEAIRAVVDAYVTVAKAAAGEREYAYGWAEGLIVAVRTLAGIWRDHPGYDPAWE